MRPPEPASAEPSEISLFELWMGMTQEAWEALGRDGGDSDDPPAWPA
jgi:hypothetical protein